GQSGSRGYRSTSATVTPSPLVPDMTPATSQGRGSPPGALLGLPHFSPDAWRRLPPGKSQALIRAEKAALSAWRKAPTPSLFAEILVGLGRSGFRPAEP